MICKTGCQQNVPDMRSRARTEDWLMFRRDTSVELQKAILAGERAEGDVDTVHEE
jgi:hypothetical protein